MDEFTIRFLFLMAGVIIGWGMGMLYSTLRFIKRVKENTDFCRNIIEGQIAAGLVPTCPVVTSQPVQQEPKARRPVPPPTLPPHLRRETDERGAVNFTTVGMVIALGVVILSLFSTLSTNDRLAETQRELASQAAANERENACTSDVLFATVDALNERTTYTTSQAQANVRLQDAQLTLVTSLIDPQQAGGENGSTAALTDYLEALKEFQRIVTLNADKAQNFPYPTQETYFKCLEEARKP